jgi:hypothetical protein
VTPSRAVAIRHLENRGQISESMDSGRIIMMVLTRLIVIQKNLLMNLRQDNLSCLILYEINWHSIFNDNALNFPPNILSYL